MKNLQFCRLSFGVILEFYYIKRGLSAILKLRVRLGLAPWDYFGDAVASIIGRLRINQNSPPPPPHPPPSPMVQFGIPRPRTNPAQL